MNSLSEDVKLETSEDESGRLNVILDRAGFRAGRGRVAEFHAYLADSGWDDLPYGTVRSWVSGHSPPVPKMETIVEKLRRRISDCPDEGGLVRWWKMGGANPFDGTAGTVEGNRLNLSYKKDSFKELDIVSQAQLISALNSKAKDHDFQIILSKNETLENILDLLAFIKNKQELRLEDLEFMNTIDTLITLMKNEVIL